MAIQQGTTTPKELRLYVSLTYAPANTSKVLDEASGKVARESTGKKLSGGAAKVLTEASQLGRKIAQHDLEAVASSVSLLTMQAYQSLGFNIEVKPIQVGSGWRLAVTGDANAQKWARILEAGYGPQDTHQFIQSASKKRAYKIKKGEVGGFYLIIPKVHGKVTQNHKGQLAFKPTRDDRLGKRIDPADIKQFEAKPLSPDVAANFAEENPDIYGQPDTVAERYTGYDSAAEVFAGEDARGRTQTQVRGGRTSTTDNHHWEVDRMVQNIRKTGALVDFKEDGKRKELYTRRDDEGELLPGLSNRKGARAVRKLNTRQVGNKVVATGVNNLRFVALDADYKDLDIDDSARQRIISRRGDVLSFVTLSTRKNLAPRPGRPAYHVMQKAGQAIEQRIRSLIAAAETEQRSGFKREAYLEVLRSALGRAL